MDNLELILQLLYKKVPARSVLEGKIFYDSFKEDEFLRLAVAYIKNYSENEAQNILSYYLDEFKNYAYLEGRNASNILNVFDALFCYAKDCLTMQGNEILCKYSKLLYWRQMTLEVSEDLIVASYFAQSVRPDVMRQRGFSWKRVIGHNNIQLKQIIQRGISENHFHLNGSAPIFHISWLSLMNNVISSKFAVHLKEYDRNRRYTNQAYSGEYKEESFYLRYLQAALIRIYLYAKIKEKRIHLGRYEIPSRKVIKCLELPDFFVNGEKKDMSVQTVKAYFNDLEFQSKTFGECFWDLYMYGKGREEAFDGSVQEIQANPEYFRVVNSNIMSYPVDKEKIQVELRSYEGTIAFRKLIEVLLAGCEKINLQEVPLDILNYEKFKIVWEEKTWCNLKNVLLSPGRIENYIGELQEIIDSFRFGSGKINKGEEIDYLLHEVNYSGVVEEDPYFVFSGERWLLYRMLHWIYTGDNQDFSRNYKNLFYAYILIKENIRSELVQVNANVGFKNFQKYQDRKADLLEDAIYQHAMAKIAFRESFITENIRTIEIRISPANTAEEMRSQIFRLDQLLDSAGRLRHQFFYTIHFIKKPDPDIKRVKNQGFGCRHMENRKKYLQKVRAILDLREEYPLIGRRILGIDAASSEIGCRPEVFGEVFRCLKAHSVVYQSVDGVHRLPQLRATYHVGEEFLDVADGLRAIDEAIRFLELDCGDRLGHALALGVDVEQWYKEKGYRIILPEQDYLDNIVWVHQRLRRYNIQGFYNLRDFIQREFKRIFERIYTINMNRREMEAVVSRANKNYGERSAGRQNDVPFDFSIYQYYNAWKLRGDDPELYKMGYFNEKLYKRKRRKEKINKKVKPELRYSAEVCLLYYYYHFHPSVRKTGQKLIQVKVEGEYILAVKEIQKQMQREISKKGLGIETNPSSNYLIGTFRSYENHPITRFYNKGLTLDNQELKQCAQIPVSINTDDQGVFSTSLENEYALMARAMEKVKDEKGEGKYQRINIYDWLDNIRIQGNEQSFGHEIYENHIKQRNS